jgi:hypothetical protein
MLLVLYYTATVLSSVLLMLPFAAGVLAVPGLQSRVAPSVVQP